ncbi:MAG: arylamine N-acetyltransferase [Oscillospiraceae bacterium]|jgi:N-hydroxyarylamine O-acetyltransferase|nr:arylamine N-acetyltransferase [Oscillospiraceae bacterium]
MIEKYLERVGYSGELTQTYETLYALHTAHVFNIPFENLDVFYGRTISLDEDALFDKLVNRRRGGYCFEMNGLFSIVLKKLGFKARNLLARTAFGGDYSAKLHQVISVEIDEKTYLADVGYGNEGIAAPLLLDADGADTEQTRFSETYRFTRDPRFGYALERKVSGGFTPMYAFTTEECIPSDFEVANHYTSTHPNSFFKMAGFITMPTASGRITLTGRHLKINENGQITEREITGESEFAAFLSEQFGLDIDAIKKI